MITKQIRNLEAARAKVLALENAIAGKLNRELAGLPSKFGFNSTAEFITAVKKASSGKKSGKKGKRTRAKITDATRAAVKKLVEAEKSGAAIAKELGISLPSVQNIKKALGLVKARKK